MKNFSYFRAMANGEIPPVKERLEMPVATQKTDTGLTQGLLRVLHKQVRAKISNLYYVYYTTIC